MRHYVGFSQIGSQIINIHHITSKTLTGIKISHAVSLQVASLARSTRGPLFHGTDRTGPNSHTIVRNGPDELDIT